MATEHILSARGEEIRLPIGGSFVISDANGRQLFRVEADGDILKAGDAPIGASLTPAAFVTPGTATPEQIVNALIAAGLMAPS